MKKLLFFLVVTLIVSCTNEDLSYERFLDANYLTQKSYKISPEEARMELTEFLSSYNCKNAITRSALETNNIEIVAIRNNETTRSASNDDSLLDSIGIDTLMYAINFADNKGFALVAADKRTCPILALIDEGSFHTDSLLESEDEAFLTFIDNAVKMEIQDIKNYSDSLCTRSLYTNGYTIVSEYGPLLHTKWTQTSVYGKYCPNGIAGCTVIATAQILSYYQTVGHVNWSYNGTMGSSDLHWEDIIYDCDTNNGKLVNSSCATSANEIAHLVRYLGISFDADYKKNATSVGESKAIEWFNKWGGLKASSLKKYNESAIISAIKSGYPVYARGNSGKKKILGIRIGWKGGHAWVYDGMLTASKNGKTSKFIHCNWGWGGYKNGYYLSKAFNTDAGVTIYDYSDNQSGTSSNYRYNLEYSIIKR